MAVQSATVKDLHLSEEDIKSRYIHPAPEDKGLSEGLGEKLFRN